MKKLKKSYRVRFEANKLQDELAAAVIEMFRREENYT